MIPKEDVESLMNEMLPFAKRMLSEHGEFLPYGGIINSDGRIVHIGAITKDGRSRDAAHLKGILKKSLCEMACNQECIATAIVLNVEVKVPNSTQKSNAVQINLDHVNNYSAEVFFPYSICEDGKIDWGEIFSQEGCYLFPGDRVSPE